MVFPYIQLLLARQKTKDLWSKQLIEWRRKMPGHDDNPPDAQIEESRDGRLDDRSLSKTPDTVGCLRLNTLETKFHSRGKYYCRLDFRTIES